MDQLPHRLKLLALFILFWFGQPLMYAQSSVKMIGIEQPIVVGKINGVKAFFLVDTGADITLLNLYDAAKYEFQLCKVHNENSKFSGLNSDNSGLLFGTRDVELKIGDKEMKGYFKAFDLSRIATSLAHSNGIRITGIIGSDLMRKYDFIIDYKSRKINFSGN